MMAPNAAFYDPDIEHYVVRILSTCDGRTLPLKGADNNILVALDWIEHNHPGEEFTQKEIATIAGTTARTVRASFRRLEKAGLIETLGPSKTPPKVLIPDGYRWVEFRLPKPKPKLFAPDDSSDSQP